MADHRTQSPLHRPDHGNTDTLGRQLVDEDAVADEYAVLKAIATGDPRIFAAAQLESRLTALERARRVHERSATGIRTHVDGLRRSIADTDTAHDRLIVLLADHRPDAATLLHHGDGTRSALPAGERGGTERLGQHLLDTVRRHPYGDHGIVATIHGIPLKLTINGYVVSVVPDGPDSFHADRDLHRYWDLSEMRRHNPNPLGIGQAATNLVRRLPELPDELAVRSEQQRRRLAELDGRADAAFPHAAELDQLRLQLTALQAQLIATDQQPDARPPTLPPAVMPTHRRPLSRSGVGIEL